MTHSVPLCNFWKCFFPPYNSSKMLQQCLKEKRSPLQLPVSFRIDFLRFYFHGSAGCVLWLYPNPWSPVQFEILRLHPFGCFLIENNTFRFFRSCMCGESHKRLFSDCAELMETVWAPFRMASQTSPPQSAPHGCRFVYYGSVKKCCCHFRLKQAFCSLPFINDSWFTPERCL